MEVGPLARVLVAYKTGQPEAVSGVKTFLAETKLPSDALYSTLGRTAARALETQIIAEAMPGWLDRLDLNGPIWEPSTLKAGVAGVGLNEAPRGALGHWIEINEHQQIGNYQMVVPSTWNFGPRCAVPKRGPVEQALVGTPVADPARPVEILRTVHSFDPCIACAVHVIDTRKDKVYRVRAL
jgi:[NiFe] hydrogenase large subunit